MADYDSDGDVPPSPHNHRSLAVRTNGSGSRKRVSDVADEPSTSRRRMREPSPERNDAVDLDAYDPDQSMQERRQIQRHLRQLQQKLKENPDEFVKSDKAFLSYLDQADNIMTNVKQTAEAAIDARGLAIAADLAARRVQLLTSGNAGNGLDVDEFVQKCISFMKNGGGVEDDQVDQLSSTQRRRRTRNRGTVGEDDDEVGDEGDMMNWAHLGRFAVIPNVHRPALLGFLMGPLSIEKKVRRVTQRSAPFKVSNLREIRPEELKAEDLKKSEKNDLPSICKKIYDRLEKAQRIGQDKVEEGCSEDTPSDVEKELMERYALRSTGGIDLLRFVVNPHSFGQTVENMFYVSFLIREGTVKLAFDNDGLPALEPVRRESSAAKSRHGAQRHQAIMSIDVEIWQDIIKAFNIREPMIPHREEEDNRGPGARGWYS